VKLTAMLVVLLFFGELGAPQKPIRPGIREADKVEAESERNLPPPTLQRTAVDPAKLKLEADELAALAASIPPAVDQANHGILPNDLPEKLKRVEKLAKRLRGDLTR